MSFNNPNQGVPPLLDIGPVSNAIIISAILFIGLPMVAVAKWILKH